MMSATTVDLAVMGGGPGGYVAAIRAAQLGMKVALVECNKLGGVCLNQGCIPTKALLRNAEVLSLVKRAADFGISFDNLRFDFSEAVKRSRRAAQRLSKGVEFLLKKNQVALVRGRGRLASPQKIEVVGADGAAQEEVEARHLILATGSRPRSLPGVVPDGKRIITSDDAMILQQVPRSMIILGAGAVGVEFSDLFNTYGAQVTLVEMLPRILPVEDPEMSELLAKALGKKGIKILTGTEVKGVTEEAEGIKVEVSVAGQLQDLRAEMAMVAIGRMPNSEEIGAQELGIPLERGFIRVGPPFRTAIPNIYAVGDLIGPPLLAHAAMAEGVVAVEAIAGMKGPHFDYENIPGCTYCQPQVASVGLSEEKAKKEGYKVKVGRFPFQANGKAQALGETEGLVKIVSDTDSGEILGVHILGSEATEMIAALGLAKTMEATPEEVARTIYAHPTLSEAIGEAALAITGKPIHV